MHKSVLEQSPTFRKLLESAEIVEGNSKVDVDLTMCQDSVTSFKVLLSYLYSGRIDISLGNTNTVSFVIDVDTEESTLEYLDYLSRLLPKTI